MRIKPLSCKDCFLGKLSLLLRDQILGESGVKESGDRLAESLACFTLQLLKSAEPALQRVT